MVKCPECDAEIDLDEEEAEEGELLSCTECETELEVVQTNPLMLKVISEEDLLDEDDEDSESDEDDDDDEDGDGISEDSEEDEEEESFE